MPLGTNHQTVTTGANFIPEIWSKQIQLATEAALVMGNLVNRFDTDAQFGDTVHVPNVSNLTTNDKLKNVSVTLQAPTESNSDINIDKHKETSFLVEDLVAKQSQYDLPQIYSKKAGYAISQQIDTDIHSLYAGLSQAITGGASTLALADLTTGTQFLDNADVPMDERSFVASPYARKDLLDLDRLGKANEAGTDAAIRKGQIGDLFGMGIYISSQTTKVTTVSHNLMFHKDAFGLAMQIMPSIEKQRKAEYLGDLYVIDAAYGFAEMRDDHAVDVQSLAT